MVCAYVSFLTAPLAFADDTQTDWPEPVYFPQTPTTVTTPTTTQTTGTSSDNTTATKKSKHKKRGGWLAKRREANQPPLTDEQITQVGPKDPPPSPYPLVRLPMPIQTGSGLIPSGIYLVKPIQPSPTASGTENKSSEISVALTRQNRVIFSFKAHPSTQPDANLALTGTPSPITQTVPASSSVTRVESRLSEDLKTLTIIITEGEQRFESEAFPVNTDTRHILTF